MKVKLPRSCTGQEILDAFNRAATTAVVEGKRFVNEERIAEVQIEPGSVRFVETAKKAIAFLEWPLRWRALWGKDVRSGKKRLMALKEKWQGCGYIELLPVAPSRPYVEVDIKFSFRHGDDRMWPCLVNDETNSNFKEVAEPLLRSFMLSFFVELGKNPAPTVG